MMRLTPMRIRLLVVAGGAAPLAALAGVRMADPFSAPASAGAASSASAIDAEPTPPKANTKPTARERAAAAHILILTADPAPPTPFYYAPGALHDDAPTAQPVETRPLEPPTPAFEVTAILSGAPSPIAVVNGKALRVGQEIAPGWRLAEVDERERSAVIAHDDGRSVRVRIRR